ncbi:hypothetical protein ACIBQ1_14990 [Nonomuraea sp. NPDC050153]|uniref:hypothetical protein n=1 Tax=Nonomuraea sp. NPDC050153 TaxID=3364359 RepID=UPI00378B7082
MQVITPGEPLRYGLRLIAYQPNGARLGVPGRHTESQRRLLSEARLLRASTDDDQLSRHGTNVIRDHREASSSCDNAPDGASRRHSARMPLSPAVEDVAEAGDVVGHA